MPMAEAPAASRRTCRLLLVSAVLALLWMFVARITGPSDLWHQTQPKTVSYTADIIAHGHWVLPIERGNVPATKPPVYNWVAAPFVWLIGSTSEIAHKMPSILALIACWVLVLRTGRHIESLAGWRGNALGAIAAIALVCCYPMFKLGYLARPDMLLTLWCTIGWLLATRLLLDSREAAASHRRLRALGFWLCVTLAALTKGPPAILLILYALVGGKLLVGRWRATGVFGWWWGLPLVLLAVGAWIWGVYRIDPVHLRDRLWYAEIAGRVTGEGPEGGSKGWLNILVSLPEMTVYYFVRFAPWSFFSLFAMIEVVRRRLYAHRETASGQASVETDDELWFKGAMIFIILIIGLFSLSSGKRADYIALAYPPGALLCAWWCLRLWPFMAVRVPWSVPGIGAVALIAMTVVNIIEPYKPQAGFGEAIMSFSRQAKSHIDHAPAEVAFWNAGATHLQAMLGCSEVDGAPRVARLLTEGEPFWLLAGSMERGPTITGDVLEMRGHVGHLEEIAVSDDLPRANFWPGTVWLYRVTPVHTPGEGSLPAPPERNSSRPD
jgi:4-amino-4-deoxy-L-arabinose transferase-like glycosyltransferase